MKVEFHHTFIKRYNQRFGTNERFKQKFSKRLQLFEANPSNPLLKNHALKGVQLGIRSFSITGDIRVLYKVVEDIAYFMDIGTHNQVY